MASTLTKDISGIIGHLVLQHRGDTLHAHSCVHMLCRQALQAGISLPVELQNTNPKLSNTDIGDILKHCIDAK